MARYIVSTCVVHRCVRVASAVRRPVYLRRMGRLAPQDKILGLLRLLKPVDAQNRLMRVPDKELALALLYMVDWQQDYVVAFVGASKGRRVRQELQRNEHVRIAYEQYLTATRVVIRHLEGGNATAPRSYFRPVRSVSAASKRAR